jgi:hypothetical protein
LHDRDDHAGEHEGDDRDLQPDPDGVHGEVESMSGPELSPRAQAILAAVEREIEELRRRTERPPEPVVALRIDTTLLAALELAVAGLSRDEVRSRIAIDDAALDAVFGEGSPPEARLSRRGAQ